MRSQMVCSVLLSVLHFKTKYLKDPDWFLKISHQSAAGSMTATQWEKWSTPFERASQIELYNSVRLFVAFCLTNFIVWQVVRWTQYELFYLLLKHDIQWFFREIKIISWSLTLHWQLAHFERRISSHCIYGRDQGRDVTGENQRES